MTQLVDIQQLKHKHLNIQSWHIEANQSWCILGKNGSGKQYLDQLLDNRLEHFQAQQLKLPSPDKVRLISFEKQQAVYEHELKIDESDITNEVDYGTPAKNFLPADKLNHPLVTTLGLQDKLNTGYRQLSTGEGRKLLILQAIFAGIELLVCDNPFDSLDVESCEALNQALLQIKQHGISVLLLLSNRTDIPAWCDKIALLERGNLLPLGDYQTAHNLVKQFMAFEQADHTDWPEKPREESNDLHTELANLNKVTVKYDDNLILHNIDLTIKPLQHTLITGKNGCGKSTLMHLITGDCPQCFSNEVTVFGYRRGRGETIWDIKKDLGIVSSELHRNYRVRCNALTVVASGFYDSIGLYKQPSQTQLKIAKQWLNKVGLAMHANTLFQQLSYGEQRLLLIARALVKAPLLLMLDEPAQGLDEINRQLVLSFLQHLQNQQHSTIVLVSHRSDEHLPLFKQHIQL
ncbi:ATP-binding cassette domain-containing protein [Catenovulum sediminis]|uniref:ATP-binding cassette domain-containing protein n=1 Tax=Catenovulum sediminis TaxID=1740262 RepID=A0ABV1RFG9_9ALTE